MCVLHLCFSRRSSVLYQLVTRVALCNSLFFDRPKCTNQLVLWQHHSSPISWVDLVNHQLYSRLLSTLFVRFVNFFTSEVDPLVFDLSHLPSLTLIPNFWTARARYYIVDNWSSLYNQSMSIDHCTSRYTRSLEFLPPSFGSVPMRNCSVMMKLNLTLLLNIMAYLCSKWNLYDGVSKTNSDFS